MRREPHPYLRGELVVVIDCSDLARSAEFWAGVLGYARDGVAIVDQDEVTLTAIEDSEIVLVETDKLN